MENLKRESDLKKIDFIVANHGECDHSGSLTALMDEIPGTPIYCTAQAVKSIEGQYGKRGWNFHVVKTGDSVDIGNGKQLVFVEMKMLHWPDSMATYMTGDNILFSNDAFGQHCAVEELFNDKANPCLLNKEAMKYFANILNPFAAILTKKLDEIGKLNLTIEMIAPSHGAIWRDNPLQIVEKYAAWAAAYQEDQVTIAYDTMREGTTKIAHKIAEEIHRQSPDTKLAFIFCLFNTRILQICPCQSRLRPGFCNYPVLFCQILVFSALASPHESSDFCFSRPQKPPFPPKNAPYSGRLVTCQRIKSSRVYNMHKGSSTSRKATR